MATISYGEVVWYSAPRTLNQLVLNTTEAADSAAFVGELGAIEQPPILGPMPLSARARKRPELRAVLDGHEAPDRCKIVGEVDWTADDEAVLLLAMEAAA